MNLPLISASPRPPTHLLTYTAQRLELRQVGDAAPGAVCVDFLAGSAAHRRLYGGGRGQAVARAVGLKHGATPQVIDATAGLGQDGFVLASLGCRVQLLERSPIIAALLQDGWQRAAADSAIGAWVRERLRVQQVESATYLANLTAQQRPDVVYLDPMYPLRRKSALTSKELRILRDVVGDDADAAQLLEIARAAAKQRVVVKRPRRAPTLDLRLADAQICTAHTRFDLYFSRQ